MTDRPNRPNDVYRFRYSPKKEWGFDGRTWCFEGFLIASADLDLVDSYWGISNPSGRVLDKATIDREVANGGSFEFYFNLDEVDLIAQSETVYYADDDLFHISEQHACSERCRYAFKKRGAERNAAKMLLVLREYLEQAERRAASAIRGQERLKRAISKVEAGDLTVHIYEG
jgi:hypothetical protein